MKRSSTWISEVYYRTVNGQGFLALVTVTGQALLYGPSDDQPDGIPSWMPGLIVAGTGRRSVGLAYNRLVKGQGYGYTRVEKDRVEELVRLMTKVEGKVAA